jgi:hypothetical protein
MLPETKMKYYHKKIQKFSCESLVFKKNDTDRLEAAQVSFLRSLLCSARLDHQQRNSTSIKMLHICLLSIKLKSAIEIGYSTHTE